MTDHEYVVTSTAGHHVVLARTRDGVHTRATNHGEAIGCGGTRQGSSQAQVDCRTNIRSVDRHRAQVLRRCGRDKVGHTAGRCRGVAVNHQNVAAVQVVDGVATSIDDVGVVTATAAIGDNRFGTHRDRTQTQASNRDRVAYRNIGTTHEREGEVARGVAVRGIQQLGSAKADAVIDVNQVCVHQSRQCSTYRVGTHACSDIQVVASVGIGVNRGASNVVQRQHQTIQSDGGSRASRTRGTRRVDLDEANFAGHTTVQGVVAQATAQNIRRGTAVQDVVAVSTVDRRTSRTDVHRDTGGDVGDMRRTVDGQARSSVRAQLKHRAAEAQDARIGQNRGRTLHQ